MKFRCYILFLLCVSVSVYGGCSKGDRPNLAKVTGIVTDNDEPLIGAQVTFIPAGFGATSYGITNDQGKFTLTYSVSDNAPGAVIGKHNVSIRGGSVDPKEAAAIKESETANLQAAKTAQEQGLEVAPVDEASRSDLPKPHGFEADVQAKGPNHFTFDIKDAKM